MRSFKSKVLSACAWAVPVLSAVLPLGRQTDAVHPQGQLLGLDLQNEYAQATFIIPCAGCRGQDHNDESLILSIKTSSSNQPCDDSKVSLNGVDLPHGWLGDVASGSSFYPGPTVVQGITGFPQHDLALEWESACLHGEGETNVTAQVLTVSIKSINGVVPKSPSGFTLSFKQQTPPEFLRLEATPNRAASEKENAESWREPPAHLRLNTTPSDNLESSSVDTPSPSTLEDDIRKLKALQTEFQELQKIVNEKQKHIDSQFKKVAKGFGKELQQCGSVSCVMKTIAEGAHGAWRVIYTGVRPNHHRYDSPPPTGSPEVDGYRRPWRASQYKQILEGRIGLYSEHPLPLAPSPQTFNKNVVPPSPQAFDQAVPPPPPHNDRHGLPRPDSPYVIALDIVLGILCCGCLVSIIHHRCGSLRTRTERAALREERSTARAFRRAARAHAWSKWWRGNWRDQQRIGDYEEKRSLIQHQESLLEAAMQEEIRQLRAAHSVVNDIISAEEGRDTSHIPSYCHCEYTSCHHSTPQAPYSPLSTASTYPPTSLPELPSRPLSRTDSLPGYRSDASSGPPAYESDEDQSEMVANGFRRYAASVVSATSSRWTPESSVVDVSPRPSAETWRFVGRVEGEGEK